MSVDGTPGGPRRTTCQARADKSTQERIAKIGACYVVAQIGYTGEDTLGGRAIYMSSPISGCRFLKIFYLR